MISSLRFFPVRSLRTCATANRHATTLHARNNQEMQLPDGRKLGYSEHGRVSDYPLLFMHGYPASRLETLGIDDTARRHNLRIITPDRNGFGLTTFDPSRRIVDWPGDVRALVQHLNIKRFAVLGGSGGSPYALACAYRLPPTMLSGVGIMGGAGPCEAGSHHMSLPYRVSAMAAHHWPASYRVLWNTLLWAFRHLLASPSGAQWIDSKLESHIGKQDDMTTEERRGVIARLVFEAFRQGTEPVVHDARLLTSSWEIPFEDVTNKVMIWHGTKDSNAPVQMIRYLAERLPLCTLQEFEEDTHFTLSRRMDEILAELVPEQSRVMEL
ncbi:hypothetical protein N7492_008306 [Penicillium capsulatum]|uniref:AB hydrolase-1 domain-containing protein n=1 Tax=Penicillium capsulatum TaxID=69766 RepID=A0A9W9LGT4_9EURO|nr:hypothetical protein N7492_008306 [Penicillium capsulatum]KAJ6105710.1 hypothetical protein N7512_009227 [Penicillium capsulatum]